MPPSSDPRQVLARFFRRHRIADLDTLCAALDTTSRMTVFRRLSAVGYRSSCSHAGRYYTLTDLPEFNPEGLWQYRGVLFSRDGTLKETVARLVERADAGCLYREIEDRVGLRVRNTVADLVRIARIAREPYEGVSLYLSADAARAHAQRACRVERSRSAASAPVEIDPSVVIEVLLEVVHGSTVRLDAAQVHARLVARGVVVTQAQVEEVFRRHGVGKKTAPSRSRPSRR